MRALDLLQRALEINPQTPKALELLENISYSDPEYVRMEGDQFIFLYLTATPVPPTESPTETAVPSATPTATVAPTASPAASPSASLSPVEAYPAAPLPPSEAYPVVPLATVTAVPESAAPTPTTPESRTGLCGSAVFAPLLILAPAGLGIWVKRTRVSPE
jgi:uncharacterized membrane protein